MQTAGFPTLPWPNHAQAYLHDAARCLALAEQGHLHLDPQGHLRRASLAALARATWQGSDSPDPRTEQAAPRLSFLVRLLAQAGLLGDIDQSLRLSDTAHEWLSRPAEEQLLALRQVWLLSPELTWCWAPANRRRKSLAPQWRFLVLETARRIAALPTDDWTPAQALRADLALEGVLEIKGVDQNLPRVRRASMRQTAALLTFLLLDVLPVLGLVDAQVLDGVTCLRPTHEGQTWLAAALAKRMAWDSPAPDLAHELTAPDSALVLPAVSTPMVHVDDDLRVTVEHHAPASYTFDIAQFAELLSPAPPAEYRVSAHSLQQAAARGYSIGDVSFLLRRFAGGPLPAAASWQLTQWQEQWLHVVYEPGFKLSFSAPQMIDSLRQQAAFRQNTTPFASGQEVWVSLHRAVHAWRYLQRLDFRLVPAAGAAVIPPLRNPGVSLWQHPGSRPGFAPASRLALPLPALLVLLQTYRQVQRLAPGLAQLNLEEFEQDLLAGLSTQAREGVEQLVASNSACLIDAWSTEGVDDSVTLHREQVRQELAQAIADGRSIVLIYADTNAQVSRRAVQPLRLETRRGHDYLVAFCQLRQDERSFRLDRIAAIARS